MSLLKAQCSNCGGRLQIDKSNGTYYCPYCNTIYILDKTNNDNINNHHDDNNQKPMDAHTFKANHESEIRHVEYTGQIKFYSGLDYIITFVLISIIGLAACWYSSLNTAVIVLFLAFAASISANMILICKKGCIELLGIYFWNCIFATEIFIFVIHTRQEKPGSLILAVIFFLMPVVIGAGLIMAIVSINEQEGFGASGVCVFIMLVSWLSRMLQTAPKVYKGAIWITFAALAVIAIIAIAKSVQRDKISMIMLAVVGLTGFFILRHLMAIY